MRAPRLRKARQSQIQPWPTSKCYPWHTVARTVTLLIVSCCFSLGEAKNKTHVQKKRRTHMYVPVHVTSSFFWYSVSFQIWVPKQQNLHCVILPSTIVTPTVAPDADRYPSFVPPAIEYIPVCCLWGHREGGHRPRISCLEFLPYVSKTQCKVLDHPLPEA